MTSIKLQPLDHTLLPAALQLDHLCFGGLWTLDGYQRELESPNSDLLAIVPAPSTPDEEAVVITDITEERSEFLVNPKVNPKANLSTSRPRATSATPSAASDPLLGLGCYWAILDEAHITILGIHPDYQRRGLGHLMLCALLDRARQRDMARATLEVRISNQSALLLYQKFGFQIAGQRKGYYTDTGEDALILWRGKLQSTEFGTLLTTQWTEIHHRLTHHHWSLQLGLELLIAENSTLTYP